MQDDYDKIGVPNEIANRPKKHMCYPSRPLTDTSFIFTERLARIGKQSLGDALAAFKKDFACELDENVVKVSSLRGTAFEWLIFVLVIDLSITTYPKDYKGYRVVVNSVLK